MNSGSWYQLLTMAKRTDLNGNDRQPIMGRRTMVTRVELIIHNISNTSCGGDSCKLYIAVVSKVWGIRSPAHLAVPSFFHIAATVHCMSPLSVRLSQVLNLCFMCRRA